MGVRSLKTFILNCEPPAARVARLAELRGLTLAVDAPCVIHRLWSRWASASNRKMQRSESSPAVPEWRAFMTRELSVLFRALSAAGCSVVLVNEGSSPSVKKRTIARRQVYRESVRTRANRVLELLRDFDETGAASPELLAECGASGGAPPASDDDEWTLVSRRRPRTAAGIDRGSVMRRVVRRYNASLLPDQGDYRTMNEVARACGARTVSGASEAETVCAALVRFGLADLTMSSDTDAVVYAGGSRVVYEVSPRQGTFSYFDRDSLKRVLGVASEEEFVCALVACGTDYNSPLRTGLTPRTALDEVRRRLAGRAPAGLADYAGGADLPLEVLSLYFLTIPAPWLDELRASAVAAYASEPRAAPPAPPER